MDLQKVIVVGAGIGGLTVALALQRRGFRVRVYERAAEIVEIGAGLLITANGQRVLAELGLDAEVRAAASCVDELYTIDYRSGNVLETVTNESISDLFGLRTLQVHRADLHRSLMQAVLNNDPDALYPGHELVGLAQDAEGVTVRFRNGAMDRGDILLGADGNASLIRSLTFGDDEARFNGQVAFRALLPMSRVPASVRTRKLAMHPAPGRMLLHYPLRGESIMNLIAVGQAENWTEESWAIPATNDEFAEQYSDFSPDLVELIHNIPEGGLFKWGLRDREPLDQWTIGRIGMLGDAAHPMTPFLGQGACMAMEDALVLARAFAVSDDPMAALTRYEAVRKPRGNSVQLWSRAHGQILQQQTVGEQYAVTFQELLEYDATSVPIPAGVSV